MQVGDHGQVVVGEDPAQVVERGVFFELACKVYLLSENAAPLRRYSPADLEVLRSYDAPPPENRESD